MSKEAPVLYAALRPVAVGVFRLLMRPKVYGRENIPRSGRAVIAGNHTGGNDCFMLMSGTDRCLHFLAKREIFKGPLKYFFSGAGIIPVDRSRRDRTALQSAVAYLEADSLIAIFPEGTTNKTGDITLPFKIGAVKMSRDTGAPIIPFTIKGRYKYRGARPEIRFYEPYVIGGEDLQTESDKFRALIENNLTGKGNR